VRPSRTVLEGRVEVRDRTGGRRGKWSSHLDYLGKHNFPSVTNREFLLSIFGDKKKYAESIKDWLKEMSLETIREFTLE